MESPGALQAVSGCVLALVLANLRQAREASGSRDGLRITSSSGHTLSLEATKRMAREAWRDLEIEIIAKG